MKRVLAMVLVGLLAMSAFADDEESAPAETAESAAAPTDATESVTATTAEAAEEATTPSPEAAVDVDTERPVAEIETDDQRFSYILGTRFGENLKEHPANVDYKALTLGIYDAMKGREFLMTDAAVGAFLNDYRTELERRYTAKLGAMAKANLEAGAEFLRKNAEKEGVVVTESGLQYRVIEQGEGPKPEATARVKVHYVGKLLNGDVFDSSREREKPAEFTLDGVIAGWTEGLQLMPVGSTYEFVIPSELAYKEKGSPPRIEPNSTLIFEVELLEIVGEEAEGEN